MRIVDCDQGSAEWFAARLGKVTASRVSDVIGRTKTGWSAKRGDYLTELVIERLTGRLQHGYVSPAMEWGTLYEPEARDTYAFLRDSTVTRLGLVVHPTIDDAAASPDGLVGDEGLVEIKCPTSATHLATLLRGAIDPKYQPQIQWQMVCTGRQWCDFVSYDPRFPTELRLFVHRAFRDDAYIAALETDVSQFLTELSSTVAGLTERYALKAAA